MPLIEENDTATATADPETKDTTTDDTVKPDEETTDAPDADADSSPDQDTDATDGVADTAPGEGDEADADEDITLDDETINALADLYGDRFEKSKPMQRRLEAAIQERVSQAREESQRSQQQQTQSQSRIQQGRTALDSILNLATSATDAVAAVKEKMVLKEGQEAPTTTLPTQEQLRLHLGQYGTAIVEEVAGTYDRALETGFASIFSDKLPEMSEPQREELAKIVLTAQRMEGDPAQSPQAKAFLVKGLFTIIHDRAFEAGKATQAADGSNKSNAAKKIASTNAVKAAQARLAAQKGNLPPKTPKSAKDATNAPADGVYDSDWYKKLKTDDPTGAEAQRYIDTIAARRRGLGATA